MRTQIAAILAAAAAAQATTQAGCDGAEFAALTAGIDCTQDADTNAFTCVDDGTADVANTAAELTTAATVMDAACGALSPADFASATQATCTTYKDSLVDDAGAAREPTVAEYASIEYAYACWGVEGATSVTAFGAAIVAAIAALAF